MTELANRTDLRVPQRFWVGLVAITIYILLAAGVANLLTAWLHPEDPAVDLALSHAPVLLLIVAGVLFVRWSGWGQQVWRVPAAFETRPRRWWMLIIPVLLLVQPILVLAQTPEDNSWNIGSVVLVAIVFTMVGFGEELYFRGIFRASVRAHFGETLTFVLTTLAFGIAHSFGSFAKGLDPAFILFQVGVTALSGALYYGAFLATGRLWVPIVLHALGDFSLTIANGGFTSSPAADVGTSPVNVAIEFALWALAFVVLISCIRRDALERKARRARA
ncbi:hypothetical protein EV379_3434 [Microterricola gilva]|uniref:CAAX prenyl protease 2/Lysostaphin resistance protein A-like domain-containing protein n=1 Tax=Microterricola gilva TaxID=393267 RepID=A0A4Q8AQZ4_9MICO|nr:CPBP family intramembrane glutamic endopeptidase [Microterricola gilva]RZU67058.1 hypothetical protein EV379_3434 [Microterricola gilva]